MRDNSLQFDFFPPATNAQTYANVVKSIVANDLKLSRAIDHSMKHELEGHLYERAARLLGHPFAVDPNELLDLYVKPDAQKVYLTKAQKAKRYYFLY